MQFHWQVYSKGFPKSITKNGIELHSWRHFPIRAVTSGVAFLHDAWCAAVLIELSKPNIIFVDSESTSLHMLIETKYDVEHEKSSTVTRTITLTSLIANDVCGNK